MWFLSLVALHLALRHLAPPWSVVDFDDPVRWLADARPEDVAAALVRAAALVVTGIQVVAIAVQETASRLGHGGLQRLAGRFVMPVLRRAAPLALVVGTAIPAAAVDHRLPVIPPPPDEGTTGSIGAPMVVVQPGDSMWRIAAHHTNGAVAPYWLDLVGLNRARFTNVDLIHPGDTVLLPRFDSKG